MCCEGANYFPVILNRVVPHEAHLPFMAWRPFLKVTVFGEAISLDLLSFTQKARVMILDPIPHDIRREVTYTGPS